MSQELNRDDILIIEQKLDYLINIGDILMSIISDFAAQQNAFNAQMDSSLASLNDDIVALNDKILQLQNSTGAITPADQALLDALQVHGKTVADKLAALDALAHPVVPVPPVTPSSK